MLRLPCLADAKLAASAPLQRICERSGRGDSRLALMLNAERKYYKFAALDVTFDNTRLLADGMVAPPWLRDYPAVCLAKPAGQSIFDTFLDDATAR